MDFKRVSRKRTDLREIYFENKFSPYAEGSCLVKFGNTHVICTASIEERVPIWLRGKQRGWITAEYGMIPRATHSRVDREISKEKSQEKSRNSKINWKVSKICSKFKRIRGKTNKD